MGLASAAVLVISIFLQGVAHARSNDEAAAQCWKKWVELRMKEVPKSDDNLSPQTGKELSQTDGAKRTRALKYQAALDALELRGKADPLWQSFLGQCIAR
jgi:uncharacterized damage-inducible protein DinB